MNNFATSMQVNLGIKTLQLTVTNDYFGNCVICQIFWQLIE